MIRCSSCGAPREDGAASCPFCHSDFTLHDRDLDTVCPVCLARVSDHAKFCHHCGTPLTPEGAIGSDTSFICPACAHDKRLVSRRLGDVNALECETCAGLWLGIDTFDLLTKKAEHDPDLVTHLITPSHARAAEQDLPPPDSSRYRACPVCHGFMVRKNFGRNSGVIIDWCGKHGIWFDDDELSRILTWIHDGGWTASKLDQARFEDRQKELRKSEDDYRVGRVTTGQWNVASPHTVFSKIVDLFSDLFSSD